MTLPTPTQAAVTAVIAERERQLEKYPPEHDARMGVHHVIVEATKRTHSSSACGYYHRQGIVEAAAMLLAAVEAMDRLAKEPGAHDERRCEYGRES